MLVSHEQWYYWYGRYNYARAQPKSLVGVEVLIESDIAIMTKNENDVKASISSSSLSQIINRSYDQVENKNANINTP